MPNIFETSNYRFNFFFILIAFQLADVKDELKTEQDTNAKYKKSYSDLQQRNTSLEQSYSDLYVKFGELQSNYSQSEEKRLGLQSALSEEQNAKSRGFDHISELESKSIVH